MKMAMMRKGEEKQKCHVRKYNTKIKMKKTSLLELSAQHEDHTKAHAREVHPQAQHKDNLFHS
jgi:hypothetical protein